MAMGVQGVTLHDRDVRARINTLGAGVGTTHRRAS